MTQSPSRAPPSYTVAQRQGFWCENPACSVRRSQESVFLGGPRDTRRPRPGWCPPGRPPWTLEFRGTGSTRSRARVDQPWRRPLTLELRGSAAEATELKFTDRWATSHMAWRLLHSPSNRGAGPACKDTPVAGRPPRGLAGNVDAADGGRAGAPHSAASLPARPPEGPAARASEEKRHHPTFRR